MSRGELTIELFDRPTEHRAIVVRSGGQTSWNVCCIDLTDVCKAKIFGYDTRAQAIKGAEWHLRWHGNGEPTCRDCGQWLSRKGSTRCRAGKCEVSE